MYKNKWGRGRAFLFSYRTTGHSIKSERSKLIAGTRSTCHLALTASVPRTALEKHVINWQHVVSQMTSVFIAVLFSSGNWLPFWPVGWKVSQNRDQGCGLLFMKEMILKGHFLFLWTPGVFVFHCGYQWEYSPTNHLGDVKGMKIIRQGINLESDRFEEKWDLYVKILYIEK